jgi:hypothetical protein
MCGAVPLDGGGPAVENNCAGSASRRVPKNPEDPPKIGAKFPPWLKAEFWLKIGC